MRNEIAKGMGINEYHSHEGISNTGMKLILDCPARYYAEYLDPARPEKERKDHFEVGKALHTMVLEPELWKNSVYIMPKCDKRTTEGKKEAAIHERNATGKTLINVEQYQQVSMMYQSLHKTLPWLKPALKDACIEHSFFWEDDDAGVQLKSRPDAYNDDFYIDLKTTQSADLGDFTRSIYQYSYHMQAAMAREALLKRNGIKYSHFIYVVVEEKYPYLAASFCLDEDFLSRGYEAFKRGALKYAECLKTNTWEGYGSKVQQIFCPPWL